MRDGDSEGMQYFDGEIEKLIRAKIVDIETGLSYSTNAGNLRLQIADLVERDGGEGNFPSAVIKPVPLRDTEIEIER
jgi:Tfp pilus assembly ATPase PilU